MMDREWLAQVCALAEADTGGMEVSQLAALLGEAAEVLPWLVMRAGGFARWPMARQALKKAARDFTRPTQMRPPVAGHPTPASDQRAALYDKARALLAENGGAEVAEVVALISRVRRDEGAGKASPSMFIRRD